MLPSSDELEAFHERLTAARDAAGKVGDAEVGRTDLLADLAAIARDWLRLSQALRDSDVVTPELDTTDAVMTEILRGNPERRRGTYYRRRLEEVRKGFADAIIVPVIKHEGSPRQVAVRRLRALLDQLPSPDEQAYIDEALRCIGQSCFRAAIIMLWAGAVARLHQAVGAVGFGAFNAALAAVAAKTGQPFKRMSARPQITSLPELQQLRDFDLLVVGMELWRYDLQAFQDLERLLGVRNGAAHPGTATPGILDVEHFATKLAQRVFSTIK